LPYERAHHHSPHHYPEQHHHAYQDSPEDNCFNVGIHDTSAPGPPALRARSPPLTASLPTWIDVGNTGIDSVTSRITRIFLLSGPAAKSFATPNLRVHRIEPL